MSSFFLSALENEHSGVFSRDAGFEEWGVSYQAEVRSFPVHSMLTSQSLITVWIFQNVYKNLLSPNLCSTELSDMKFFLSYC